MSGVRVRACAFLAGVSVVLGACAGPDGQCTPVDTTSLQGLERTDVGAEVTVDAILYVFRGACPEPGAEETSRPVGVKRERVSGSSAALAADITFMELAAPPGPLATYCARVVYEAVGPASSTGHFSAWNREELAGARAARLGHQQSVENFRLRPLGGFCPSYGEFVGDDPAELHAAVDPDGDGIPNFREVQLGLRPHQADDMEAPPETPKVTVAAATFAFGAGAGEPGPILGNETTSTGAVTASTVQLEVDVVEVTNRQYRACMGRVVDDGEGPTWACLPPVAEGYSRGARKLVDPLFGLHPVVGTTHEQAERFCARRGMRLPTEIEWERVARLQRDGLHTWPWGDNEPSANPGNDCTLGRFLLYTAAGSPQPCNDAPFMDTDAVLKADGTPKRVPQANGLADLAGNVAEWTADTYEREFHERVAEGASTSNNGSHSFTVRGGSFRSGVRFVRGYARAAVDDSASSRDDTLLAVGIRCVRTLP